MVTFSKEKSFKLTPAGMIPKDWEAIKLGEIITYVKGKKPRNMTEECQEGYLPYLSTEYLRYNKATSFVKPSKDVTIVDDGDLILLWDGSNAGEFFLGKRGVLSSTMVKIEQKEPRYNQKFLFYLLKTKENFLKAQTKGTGIPHVERTVLNNIFVPYLSIEEQRDIVGVLSVVDLATQKTDEIIAKTERLKRGLMQTLLTKGIGHKEFKQTPIGKIPKTWKVTTIDEECFVGTGGTPPRNNPRYFGGNIPWVKSTEVNYNIITKTEETLTESGLQNSSAKMYSKGSLIVALYGQGVTRGKCAILGVDAAINQACAAIQSKGRIYIPYLFYWFQNSYVRIRRLSQGANQANLNMKIIRSLKIPLPPLYEQQKIAEMLSKLDEKLELEKNEKTRLERIKRGLMDLLLTGKIRVRCEVRC